jgi:ABC-2 type transport system permease protein
VTVTEARGTVAARPAGRVQRIWAARSIIALLVRRDLKVRYADSYLGYVWSILEPLAMSLVYWVVMVKVLNRHAPEKPYLIFLLSGQLAWFWFNGTVTAVMRSMRTEAALIRSTNLPREIWVVRVILSKAVEFFFSLVVLAAFVGLYRKSVTPEIILFPVGLLLQALMLLGLGLILAPVTVLVKDMDKIVPIVLRILFYFSPILYSIYQVPKAVRPYLEFNPLIGIFSFYRAAFFHGELKSQYILLSVGTTVVLLILGVFTFRRLEPAVLKEI